MSTVTEEAKPLPKSARKKRFDSKSRSRSRGPGVRIQESGHNSSFIPLARQDSSDSEPAEHAPAFIPVGLSGTLSARAPRFDLDARTPTTATLNGRGRGNSRSGEHAPPPPRAFAVWGQDESDSNASDTDF